MALADKDTYLILEDEASFNVVADTDLFVNAASGFMSLGFSYQLLIQQTHSHLGSVFLWQLEIHLKGEGCVLV